MVNVDLRTRSDAELRTLDFVSFHEQELPLVLRSPAATLAARGFAVLGLQPLTLQVDGRSYTYAVADGSLTVRPGDHADAVAALSAAAFSDLMQEQRSTIALVIGDEVRMLRGSQRTFVEWEPVLRALLDGRPVYEPGSIEMRDRDGLPLRLTRTFTPGDPPAEMAHFLGAAGFLHIAGVFAPDEMAAVSADIDRAAPTYAPNDGRSWWARTRAGEHRPVRLQYFQEHSAITRALLADARLFAIADLTANAHRQGQRREGNAIEALIKPIGVTEGISDVSWHKDCSLGRHSYQCCGITVGISVTDSDTASGQLCVVAGSHRANVPLRGLRDDLDLPRIGLPTRAGDVTVHLSCTLHMSIPPTARERRVMYTGFALPPRAGDSRTAGDALRAVREQAPRMVAARATTSISDDPEMERVNRFDTRGLRPTR